MQPNQVKIQFPGDLPLPEFTRSQVDEIARGLMVFTTIEQAQRAARALAIALDKAWRLNL